MTGAFALLYQLPHEAEVWPVGLNTMLSRLLGVKNPMKESVHALMSADPLLWSRRPLHSNLLQYAVHDVAWLFGAYLHLSAQIQSRGLLEQLRHSCQARISAYRDHVEGSAFFSRHWMELAAATLRHHLGVEEIDRPPPLSVQSDDTEAEVEELSWDLTTSGSPPLRASLLLSTSTASSSTGNISPLSLNSREPSSSSDPPVPFPITDL